MSYQEHLSKVECSECSWHGLVSACLKAENPFQPGDEIAGCPSAIRRAQWNTAANGSAVGSKRAAAHHRRAVTGRPATTIGPLIRRGLLVAEKLSDSELMALIAHLLVADIVEGDKTRRQISLALKELAERRAADQEAVDHANK